MLFLVSYARLSRLVDGCPTERRGMLSFDISGFGVREYVQDSAKLPVLDLAV